MHPFGKSLVQGFVIGLALPVGSDFLHDDFRVFRADGGRRLFAGGQIAHRDVEEVAVEFRVQNAVTAYLGAGAAEKKLPVLHFHGHVSGDVHEGLGPAQNQRLTFGFLHGLGEIQGAFHVDDGRLTFKLGDEVEHTGMRVVVFVLLALLFVEDALFLRRMTFTGFGIEHFDGTHD